MQRAIVSGVFILTLLAGPLAAQPEVPVEQWRGKTIMLIGAHPGSVV